jgi:hypothetical protein
MRASRSVFLVLFLLAGCPDDTDDATQGTTAGGGSAGQNSAGQGAGAGSAAGVGATAGAIAGAGTGAGSGGLAGAGSVAGASADLDASVAPDAADGGECDLPCEAGQHCELVEVTCIQAPCPPQPECVADTVNCDVSTVACLIATPGCSEGEVPSVNGLCYGPCVPVENCACNKAEDCPDSDKYTCHLSAGHCGPYVN